MNGKEEEDDQGWSRAASFDFQLTAQPESAVDSSYDSDQECNSELRRLVGDLVDSPDADYGDEYVESFDLPLDSRTTPLVVVNDVDFKKPQHGGVDRTVSETLSREYSEYITRELVTKKDKLQDKDPEKSKIAFAAKLGYSERETRQALDRLGASCTPNELLAELIRISTGVDVNKPSSRHPLLAPSSSSVLPASSTIAKQVVGRTKSSPVLGSTGSTVMHISPFPAVASTSGNVASNSSQFRSIVIDGSNVAITHGNREFFSCRGLQIVVDWFLARGHQDISIFVPMWRKNSNTCLDVPTKDGEILLKLEQERLVHFTPSRMVNGRMVASYDDRYVLNCALKNDGIIVSNDTYRDLTSKNPQYTKLVNERLLMYVFVNDEFMPPDDPLGQYGPTLTEFLSKPMLGENTRNATRYQQICPYGQKCTYGTKCKYYHPERTERAKLKPSKSSSGQRNATNSTNGNPSDSGNKQPLCHWKSLPMHTAGSLTGGPTSYSSSDLSADIARAKSISEDSKAEPKRVHRKLERQTALNSAADPRLHHLIRRERLTKTQSWNPEQGTQINASSLLSTSMAALRVEENSRGSHRRMVKSNSMSIGEMSNSRTTSQRSLSPGQASGHYLAPGGPLIGSSPCSPQHHHQAEWQMQAGHVLVEPGGKHNGRKQVEYPRNATLNARNNSAPTESPQPSSSGSSPIPPFTIHHFDQERRKLYFHLSSLFPQDKVYRAMSLMPDETNPQVLCRFILQL